MVDIASVRPQAYCHFPFPPGRRSSSRHTLSFSLLKDSMRLTRRVVADTMQASEKIILQVLPAVLLPLISGCASGLLSTSESDSFNSRISELLGNDDRRETEEDNNFDTGTKRVGHEHIGIATELIRLICLLRSNPHCMFPLVPQ